jgi:hypothetical protein
MMKIIQNPLFRIIGIGVILYYGLFHNKYNDNSLRNRLSPEKLKADLSEVSSKTVYIINGVQKAKSLQKDLENKTPQEQKPTQTDQKPNNDEQ